MGGLSPLFWFFLNNSKSLSLFYYTLIWNTNTKFGVKCSNQSPDSGQKPGSFFFTSYQLELTCSKLMMEAPQLCVKSVQN